MQEKFEALYTWRLDIVILFLRYFIIAGIAWVLCYKLFVNYLYKFKIQKKIPSLLQVRREVSYSISTLVIYSLASWFVFFAYKKGYTKIYFDIDDYGIAYLIGSFLAMVVIHDTFFYWTHRLIHHPKIFRPVHIIHHQSTNPSPWAAFSFHPLEATLSIGIIPIIIFFIPAHPLIIGLFLTNMTLVNVMGHLGFEFFPIWFRKSWIGKFYNTATNHDLHHSLSKGNYGLYFSIWDKWMGTYIEKA